MIKIIDYMKGKEVVQNEEEKKECTEIRIGRLVEGKVEGNKFVYYKFSIRKYKKLITIK